MAPNQRDGRHRWLYSAACAHPVRATHSISSVHTFPSVFCSVKFLFKCRCTTGTSENCFPWSVHAIIMTIVSKEKLILYEKWQNSNKMWPWIQMYLYWGKKLSFLLSHSNVSLVTQELCFLINLFYNFNIENTFGHIIFSRQAWKFFNQNMQNFKDATRLLDIFHAL